MIPAVEKVHSVAVLTGAGISAESGIPTFRGDEGLWRSHRAEDLATLRAFRTRSELVWEWYNWRRELISACQPNAAHRALVDMEHSIEDFVLITQNVDGLHHLAGSRDPIELHGNIWRMRCTENCQAPWEDRRVPLPAIPPHCPKCKALARPDVVWFGEPLPVESLNAAMAAAQRCQVMLVIGTSALVQPAASLPLLALQRAACVVEINPKETPLSGYVAQSIRQAAAVALPHWWHTWAGLGRREPDNP